jgi:hypothetical protein
MADTPLTSEGSPVPVKSAATTAAPSTQDKQKAKKVANTSKRGRNQAKGMIEVEPVMGTRDFYPEDMRLRNWLFDNFRQVAKSFCFQVRRKLRIFCLTAIWSKFVMSCLFLRLFAFHSFSFPFLLILTISMNDNPMPS